MKKVLFIGAILAVAVVILGVAGFAYAQTQTPEEEGDTGSPATGVWPWDHMRGFAPGMGWRAGGERWGGPRGFAPDEYPPMHEYMHDDVFSAIADVLGLTPEELEARHEAGETLWDIAQEQGLSIEEFSDLLAQVRTDAINQAVADGVITQEQADWMLDRMNQMWGAGFGPGKGFAGPMMSAGGAGPLHDYMLSALAGAFDLTPEELQARFEAGETLVDLAIEQDLTVEAFRDLMVQVRTQALEQAVADGVITQEQADWMLERQGGRGFGGFAGPGFGGCPGPGRHGHGMWSYEEP